MSRSDVKACLDSAGVPSMHFAWPEGSAPELPWAVFYLDGQNGFYADDSVWSGTSRWCVELYQRSSDTELENRVEAAIQDAFGPWSKTEQWVESENAVMTVYRFTQSE